MTSWVAIINSLLWGCLMILLGLQDIELLSFLLCVIGFALLWQGACRFYGNVLFLKIVRKNQEEASGEWMVLFTNDNLEEVVVLGWYPNEQAARSGAANRLAQVRTASSRLDADELYVVRPDGNFYRFSETSAAAA